MRLKFENCEIDLDLAELRRDGQLVRVEPKIFGLLVYLAENAGRVISRDELLSEVWEGRIVSDSAISSRISAARKAIGDSGKNQRLIKTVSKQGFRFLADVVQLERNGSSLQRDTQSGTISF